MIVTYLMMIVLNNQVAENRTAIVHELSIIGPSFLTFKYLVK